MARNIGLFRFLSHQRHILQACGYDKATIHAFMVRWYTEHVNGGRYVSNTN